MFAEEETELKEQLMQNLENSGFLSRVRAELRAAVFLAFEEEGISKEKNPLQNRKLVDFLITPAGKLAASVVREFLECLELNYTLSVFDQEVTESGTSRERLSQDLKVEPADSQEPLLVSLIKRTDPSAPKNAIETRQDSAEVDPFFDEPLPSEKPNLFPQESVEKQNNSGLSSLKDLPSLSGKSPDHDWQFGKGVKSTLPSLDLLSATDGKEEDAASEKQVNSEESIEEEIEEELSAGLDEILNSSLSLGEDVTTDQTVSQVNADSCDHIEPCDSLT